MIPALFLLAISQVSQLDNWQQAIDRIAPFMSDFKVEKDNDRMNKAFAQIVAKVGQKAWFDKEAKKQHPGLYLFPYGGAIPVSGAGGGTMAWICRVNQTDSEDAYGSVLAYFAKERGKMRGWSLRQNTGANPWAVYGDGRPDHACRPGEYLVASGMEGWTSNFPSAYAEVFHIVDGNWVSVSRLESEYQAEEAPQLSLSKDGAIVIAPVLSTTYPKHLSACHATAQLAYEEKWTISSGQLKLVYKRLRMTPYNQLEKLYDALYRGDEKLIQGLCVNSDIAKEVVALKPRTAKGSPDTSFPNGNCSTDSKQIGVDNLRTWFHFTRRNGRWVVAKLMPYEGRTQ